MRARWQTNYKNALTRFESRRLVPITELPPLIGAKNTHAAQALLQIFILDEFAKQSDRLATHGSILLPPDKWSEFAQQAGLPQSFVPKVVVGWTEDDRSCKAFLQRNGDEYTLGPSYSREVSFLEDQGRRRIQGAEAGKKSAESRKNIAEHGYSKRKKIPEKS